ncbi:MAG TPA: caspase family protein [Bacteroidia bacterium]|nr:caspase family protein [Bacteroidia bacterium]
MTKILCIHGIGGKDATIDQWSEDWKKKIFESSGLDSNNVTFEFLKIDDLFALREKETGSVSYGKMFRELIASWIRSAFDDRSRAFGLKDNIRWYAGMVAQFATDEQLRKLLNKRLGDALNRFQPDLVYAHSLGTLITYDLLAQEATKKVKRDFVLVTSGAQIGHPAMRTLFAGMIRMLNVKFWYNFHNENDIVFAYKPIVLNNAVYMEIETPFRQGGINHEVLEYMGHENAVNMAWPQIRSMVAGTPRARSLSVSRNVKKTVKRKPTRKALLVGINNYPDPENNLNGCHNDVFRMSEVLQETGFSPEEIRVTLDERATSKNIRERMQWLLSDAEDGDTRFFFYSGHGARIPASHDELEGDHQDECLVTHDFDWNDRSTAYTDKEFLEAYSQVSYGVNFITMLDCCHSGGMSRDGANKARGITPPDDIRHRELKWDAKRQMWIPRKLDLSKKKIFTAGEKEKQLYTGEDGATHRFGRGVPLWTEERQFEKAKAKYGHKGAYMPLIIEACGEKEFSYEYRHGVTSYGAFTYSITTILRDLNREKKKVSYRQLMKLASQRLAELEFEQTPVIVGPDVKVNAKVPLLAL